MKTRKQILFLFIINCFGMVFSQTPGTLTFSFTEVSKSASATFQSQGRHVIAVWIQNTTGTGTGTFVKSKLRYGGLNSTQDHLPTWAANSGGPSTNCMSANCNIVSATTGATRSSFGNQSITWDGTNAAGTLVADGTYKVTIEETWNHGGTGTAVRSFTFVKGPNADVQTPTADNNFSNIALSWQPSGVGVEEVTSQYGVRIHPNPSNTGVFTVDFEKADYIKVLDIEGEEILVEEVKENEFSKSVNLSNSKNGVYFICVVNSSDIEKHKVILEK